MGQFPKDIAKASILIIVLRGKEEGCGTIVVTKCFQSMYVVQIDLNWIQSFCMP